MEATQTATIAELQAVEGVGKTRAAAIKEALGQMKTDAAQPHILAVPMFE